MRGHVVDWQGQEDIQHLQILDSLAVTNPLSQRLSEELRIAASRHLRLEVYPATKVAIKERNTSKVMRIVRELKENMKGNLSTPEDERLADDLISHLLQSKLIPQLNENDPSTGTIKNILKVGGFPFPKKGPRHVFLQAYSSYAERYGLPNPFP